PVLWPLPASQAPVHDLDLLSVGPQAVSAAALAGDHVGRGQLRLGENIIRCACDHGGELLRDDQLVVLGRAAALCHGVPPDRLGDTIAQYAPLAGSPWRL